MTVSDAPAVNVSVAEEEMNEPTREASIENFFKDSCARNRGVYNDGGKAVNKAADDKKLTL